MAGKNTSIWAYKNISHAYHQYSCTVRNGKTICGGQDRQGSAFGGPGKPSSNTFSSQQCVLKQPDNDCFEECMQDQWQQPRPKYNIGNWSDGSNCQKYDNDVNNICKRVCHLE